MTYYSVGNLDSIGHIATHYRLDGPRFIHWWREIFQTHSDQPWGPPSLLYNECSAVHGFWCVEDLADGRWANWVWWIGERWVFTYLELKCDQVTCADGDREKH